MASTALSARAKQTLRDERGTGRPHRLLRSVKEGTTRSAYRKGRFPRNASCRSHARSTYILNDAPALPPSLLPLSLTTVSLYDARSRRRRGSSPRSSRQPHLLPIPSRIRCAMLQPACVLPHSLVRSRTFHLSTLDSSTNTTFFHSVTSTVAAPMLPEVTSSRHSSGTRTLAPDPATPGPVRLDSSSLHSVPATDAHNFQSTVSGTPHHLDSDFVPS